MPARALAVERLKFRQPASAAAVRQRIPPRNDQIYDWYNQFLGNGGEHSQGSAIAIGKDQ